MRRARLAMLCALALFTPAIPACSQMIQRQTSWPGKSRTVELFTGTSYNFPTRLKIEQAGQPDIDFTAKYSTRPFSGAPYFAARFGKWKDGQGWELELIHNKLYLDNNPPDVQEFTVTHGYSLLTINRAWRGGGLIYHVGAGLVIAHPENTVRNQPLTSDHYHVTGPSAQFAVGKRFGISHQMFATVEGKLTAAYASVPVANGHASVPNLAVHGLVGIGYAF